MQLSINPTYFCNFRCPNCYLGEDNLSDKKTLNLLELQWRLEDICNHVEITHVDLYGGEIGLLPHDYLEELEDTISKFYGGSLNVITNLSNIHDFFLQDNVEVSVSYDYHYREQHERVLQNLIQIPKDVHIIVLATDAIIKNADIDIPIMNTIFSTLGNVKSVEIKPYSGNLYNYQYCTYLEYEEYVTKWLALEGDYELVNCKKIDDCLSRKSSSFSNDHIYINPNGRITVLEFFKNGDEYFKELWSFNDYRNWCVAEKTKVLKSKICGECDYVGHCLSEHLKEVKTLENGCNGFKGLLDARMEA